MFAENYIKIDDTVLTEEQYQQAVAEEEQRAEQEGREPQRIAYGTLPKAFWDDYKDRQRGVYWEINTQYDGQTVIGKSFVKLISYCFVMQKNGTYEMVGDEITRDKWITDGYTCTDAVETETFRPYSTMPRGRWWDIQNGKFVPKYTPAQITEYINDMQTISKDKADLSALDYKTNKWIEGAMTEEEWASVKAERSRLRTEINTLEEKWGINEKE